MVLRIIYFYITVMRTKWEMYLIVMKMMSQKAINECKAADYYFLK